MSCFFNLFYAPICVKVPVRKLSAKSGPILRHPIGQVSHLASASAQSSVHGDASDAICAEAPVAKCAFGAYAREESRQILGRLSCYSRVLCYSESFRNPHAVAVGLFGRDFLRMTRDACCLKTNCENRSPGFPLSAFSFRPFSEDCRFNSTPQAICTLTLLRKHAIMQQDQLIGGSNYMIDVSDIRLAPYPKKLTAQSGVFTKKGKLFIQLLAPQCAQLLPAARQTGLIWKTTASPKAPKSDVCLVIRLDEIDSVHPEGYKLTVKPDIIEIVASSPTGAFRGASTLKQIVRQCREEIPCMTIADQPDFPTRGVMLDISRDKVPNMKSLYRIVNLLSDWKINQFQLYTEHTFTYLQHPAVWRNASPMTGDQILRLDEYCRSKFIELVPNQNSFGHMERWLKHDEYRPLAEHPQGGETAWGYMNYPFSLCPTDKRSLTLVRGMFEELLPHFTSRMFNVGCDETADLGYGRSKAACDKLGKGRVYLDFLLEIHKAVTGHGRRMQFWGDIILHSPEFIAELPEGCRRT